MSDYLHGVRVQEINEGTRPIRTISTAIIGFVATASDADPTYFPEGQSTLITDVSEALGKAGNSGTLASTLDAINDQTNAVCVAVRVPESENADEQTSHIIGGNENGRRTGLQALLTAKTKHGVTPRILGVPGLDNQAVTSELVTIAQKVRGFGYAACHGATISEAQAYRQNFGARELMLIDNDFTGFDAATSTTKTLHSTARALGLRAKIDHDIGWHKTLSNIEVNGVTGTVYDRSFDLMSSDTDANFLNSHDITTLVREKGFRFWGNRTCSSDPLFAFENYTRTAQVLIDTMGYAHFWAMDKGLSPGLAGDIVEGIDVKMKELTTAGYLIGGEAWFDPKYNTVDSLKAGKLWIDYDYTPVPPLDQLGLHQRITGRHLLDFSKKIAA